MGNKRQAGYPSDGSDEEWGFVAPYLVLCREDAFAWLMLANRFKLLNPTA
jgi:hypothetical protein